MDKVVVDASIAVKWVLKEDNSIMARTLLNSWRQGGVTLLAPILLASETANILHRAAKNGQMPFRDVKVGWEENIFLAFTFDYAYMTASDFFLRVLDLARDYQLPAVYDAHYLALAEREQCDLWTADKRFYNSVHTRLSWVHLLA